MIVLAMLVYAAFFQGAQIAWWVFVLAALFDWQMAEYIFPQQKCEDCRGGLDAGN